MFQLSNTDVHLSKQGYTVKRISKRLADKDEFGEGMEEIVSVDCLKNEVRDAITLDGRIYALYKKKKMVMCYIFTKNGTEKDNDEVLKLTKTYIHPDAEPVKDIFEKYLYEDMKELVIFCYIKAVDFGDKRLEKKEYSTSIGKFSGGMIAFSMGLMFGVALDNIFLGLCFGFALFPLYSVIWSTAVKNEEFSTGRREK